MDILKGIVKKSSSLSRILDHVNDKKFAVISAFRSEFELKENYIRNVKLREDIKSMGYGFIMLKSKWVENGETSEEESFFVPKMIKKHAIKLGVKYGQFSVLVKDDDLIENICTDGKKCGKVGSVIEKFSKTNISEKDFLGAFSALKKGSHRNKRIKFSSVDEMSYTSRWSSNVDEFGCRQKIVVYSFNIGSL